MKAKYERFYFLIKFEDFFLPKVSSETALQNLIEVKIAIKLLFFMFHESEHRNSSVENAKIFLRMCFTVIFKVFFWYMLY